MDEQTSDQSVDQAGQEPTGRPEHGNQPMPGRVALVAGASKGLGAATAEAFAAAGAPVVLGARHTAALESVANRIRSRGGQALAVRLDVTDAESVSHLVDQALTAFGRLDAAFNNASGGPLPAPLAGIYPREVGPRRAPKTPGTLPTR